MMPARHIPTMAGGGGSTAAVVCGFASTSGLTLGQFDPLDSVPRSTDETDFGRMRDDDFDSKSGSENPDGGGGSGADEPEPNQRKRKKRYHRHTQHQIQEMEAFFKECPHPDDKQRKELSRELGLEPLQIKFWFQNKRTQMKMQHERHDNTYLRNENEKLRAENMRYRDALGNSSCPSCGGPTALGEMSYDEHQLRVENSRLRDEIDRMAAIAAKYVGKPVLNYPVVSPLVTPPSLELGNFGGELYGTGDLLRPMGGPPAMDQTDKQIVVELAVAAMVELTQMAQMGESLWIPGTGGNTCVLNEEEYFRTYSRGLGPKALGFRSEASRETTVVIMNHVNLVEILMDVNQWARVFSGIVSRAATLEVLSAGVAGSYNGALQVMSAEFHVLSPVVPTREIHFVRYCKHHMDGMWAVVDVSLDNLQSIPVIKCQKRPSGCLIQEMPNGHSKVTWIEHMEVDDRGLHNLYRPFVSSGLAFGAKRWIFTLDRQSERLASAMSTTLSRDFASSVITSIEGKRSILKLAERMVISFCGGVSASSAHTWTTLSGSGADDVRVMTRKSIDDPGRPPGIVLSAATSFWLPVPPKQVFDFLRNEQSRNEWDILSTGGVIQEMAHISNGHETGNCVSILRVNSKCGSQNNMLIVQESCTDPTGSYVIYAPVDVIAMNLVLAGGDPDYVPILPSGFCILPDGPSGHENDRLVEDGPGGSLLTVAFQILVDSIPTAKLSLGSVATVNNLIACTVERIKASVAANSA